MSTIDWHSKRDNFDHKRVPEIVRDLWKGDPESLQMMGQAYNIVYRFEVDGAGRYLRIGHIALHPLKKVRHVMHFLRFLADNDVPVGEPVPSVNGKHIETFNDGYYASAQLEAPGEEIGLDHTDLSVYEAWGKSLGKLHAVSRKYIPSPDIDYEFPMVQGFWKNIENDINTQAPADVQAVYAELTYYIQNLPEHDYGLIHGDYRPGNVIWDGKTARTVDFDEPNYHWYIADVSRALLEFHGRPAEQRRAFREAFMRGYNTEHTIDDYWVTQLTKFAQWRGMLMYGWDLQEGSSGSWGLDWILKPVTW